MRESPREKLTARKGTEAQRDTATECGGNAGKKLVSESHRHHSSEFSAAVHLFVFAFLCNVCVFRLLVVFFSV